jgi:hypothetical protein
MMGVPSLSSIKPDYTKPSLKGEDAMMVLQPILSRTKGLEVGELVLSVTRVLNKKGCAVDINELDNKTAGVIYVDGVFSEDECQSMRTMIDQSDCLTFWNAEGILSDLI